MVDKVFVPPHLDLMRKLAESPQFLRMISGPLSLLDAKHALALQKIQNLHSPFQNLEKLSAIQKSIWPYKREMDATASAKTRFPATPSIARPKSLPRLPIARESELDQFLKTFKPTNESADRMRAEAHFQKFISRKRFRDAQNRVGIKGRAGRPRNDD
jgi:hypothetical protein